MNNALRNIKDVDGRRFEWTHVDCSDDKCSRVLIPPSFIFFISRSFKVMNMFDVVVCCNLVSGAIKKKKKQKKGAQRSGTIVSAAAYLLLTAFI